MLVIYELINLLPKDFTPPLAQRELELFQLLRKDQQLTNETAAISLLGQDASREYFNKIRRKLKQNLINHLMVTPAIWADNEQKLLCDKIHKEFSTYKILLASGQRNIAIQLAESILQSAQKLELHEIVYMIAIDLEYHYSCIDLSSKKAKKHIKLANDFLELINAGRVIRYHYCQTSKVYTTLNNYSLNTKKLFEEAVKKTYSFRKLNSDKLNRLIYNLIIRKHYAFHDYPKVLRFCNEALRSFNPKHPNINAFRFAFLQKKTPALIALSRFEEAKKISKEAGNLIPKGKFNWHLIILQRLEICFHARDFQEAYDLYKAHKKYICPYPVPKEYWKIIRAILYFMIQVGTIQPYDTERFNLGKFLNEVPIYSQDKAGININILIIQILIEMQRQQFGRIIDRIEALNAYSRKHTRKIETVRAYIFIQMIIAMEKASFHKAGTERKTKKLLEKLKNTPIRLRQNLAVEIVPYEILWQEMLNLLENKFRATKINKKKPINKDI